MSDPADTPRPKRSLRQRERDLELRASLIDTETTITFKQSARIILRAASYLRYFVGRSIVKLAMTWVGQAIPIFVLAWFGKILVDHVILGVPIAEAEQYPAHMTPVLQMLQGYSAFEIMIFLAIVGVGLMLLMGAHPSYRDDVEAGLLQGRDYATTTENALHGGHSSLGAVWGYVEFTMNMRLTQALNHTVRSHVFNRIMGLSMTRLEDQRIGDSIYRVLYDTPQINEIFYQIVHTPVMTISLFIVTALTMLSAYPTVPELLWMTVVILPLWFGVSSLFAPIVRRRGQAARAAGALTTSTIEEGMDNVLAVQSLGGNKKERGRFGGDSSESFKRHRIQSLVWMAIFWVNGAFNQIIELFFFCYVLFMVFDGKLSVGDFGVLLAMIGQLRGRAQELAWIWIRFQDNVAAMRRVFAMMDLPPEDDVGRDTLPPIREGVTMRRAGLVYPDGRRALEGVDLTANVGEIVAFVGPTGAGKTSLAYLIPRFHEATEGEVRIDGRRVDDLTLDSLRSQVTYVFQETQLFRDSIFDNIRYGKPDAHQSEVERVAKIAGIHDFIVSLPDGYETELGTVTSSKISVGQKQRIAIARGLLRDSRILILDEPTSALDPETEEYLVRSLHEAAKDRLVIIIAHRLSTIANADKIVFLEEGRVVEQGGHAELLAREGGRYREFVELQTTAAT
ncbi:MAG: ABC transporter ATP-binding protein [Gammaproteobacteria bacterium]|nr:ABC transporter ATP-binding protein [Gammaproteobacteria bacterium]MDE0443861.1 ABC transporter ATP-binding protein [Gammaproteobacteria bacterium]